MKLAFLIGHWHLLLPPLPLQSLLKPRLVAIQKGIHLYHCGSPQVQRQVSTPSSLRSQIPSLGAIQAQTTPRRSLNFHASSHGSQHFQASLRHSFPVLMTPLGLVSFQVE